MSEQQEPTVITLNDTNSIQILAQYIEVAQQKGAFLLNEAELLKRCIDILINKVPDNEISFDIAKNVLIQAANKGQKHGSYTLNDASLISKVVQYVNNSLPAEHQQQLQGQPQPQTQPQQTQPQQTQPQQTQPQQTQPKESLRNDDLSDLAEPIPLKPKEV
jgi:hypothetical protein